MDLAPYRKSLLDLLTTGLMIAALWWPQAGLLTVDEVGGIVDLVITVSTLLSPLLVFAFPNVRGIGAGPLAPYRKFIATILARGVTLLALWWPQAGILAIGDMDAVAGAIVTLAALVGPLVVYLAPNRS